MQLNRQKLEYLIAAVDTTPSGSIERAVMKGSLLIELSNELHSLINPPVDKSTAKEPEEKKLEAVKK